MRTLLLLPVLAGCGPDPACEAVGDVPPSVQLGSGIDTFVPVGGTVEVSRGFQGGIHVWGALRTTGLAQDPSRRTRLPLVTLVLLEDGAAIGGFSRVAMALQPVADGVLEGLALQAVFDATDPGDVVGDTVTLHAEVLDFCRTRAEADATVEIIDADTGF